MPILPKKKLAGTPLAVLQTAREAMAYIKTQKLQHASNGEDWFERFE